MLPRTARPVIPIEHDHLVEGPETQPNQVVGGRQAGLPGADDDDVGGRGLVVGSGHVDDNTPVRGKLPEPAPLVLINPVTSCVGRLGRRSRPARPRSRSEEHTSELQSLMRISYAVFCLQKKNKKNN